MTEQVFQRRRRLTALMTDVAAMALRVVAEADEVKPLGLCNNAEHAQGLVVFTVFARLGEWRIRWRSPWTEISCGQGQQSGTTVATMVSVLLWLSLSLSRHAHLYTYITPVSRMPPDIPIFKHAFFCDHLFRGDSLSHPPSIVSVAHTRTL